jgi:hypothetical protein
MRFGLLGIRAMRWMKKGPASRAETGRLIDRRDSSRGATFVAIMQATDLW